jgi:hypothetical protein
MAATKTERKVTWTMLDGNTMAGTVTDSLGGTLWVRRVDGGSVSIHESKTRPATDQDILDACDFYRTLGR